MAIMTVPSNGLRRPIPLAVAALVFLSMIYLLFWHDSLILRTSYQKTNTVPDAPYGTLRPLTKNSRFAITTLLGDDTLHESEDAYYVASRVLTHQLLHDPVTRIRPENRHMIDWIVMVTPGVEQWKRTQLERDGARIIEVASKSLPTWIVTSEKRWKDQFAKLELLTWEQYSRVLFLDADHLILTPLDGVFNQPAAITPARTNLSLAAGPRPTDGGETLTEGRLPAEYVFLANQDHMFLGERNHASPPDPQRATNAFSGGFWMMAPSRAMYDYLWSLTRLQDLFDPSGMEQSLLNYAFRRCGSKDSGRSISGSCARKGVNLGPMPWGNLGWEWSSTWPSVRDVLAGAAALHEKFWKTGPEPLQLMWYEARKQMEAALGDGKEPLLDLRAEGRSFDYAM